MVLRPTAVLVLTLALATSSSGCGLGATIVKVFEGDAGTTDAGGTSPTRDAGEADEDAGGPPPVPDELPRLDAVALWLRLDEGTVTVDEDDRVESWTSRVAHDGATTTFAAPEGDEPEIVSRAEIGGLSAVHFDGQQILETDAPISLEDAVIFLVARVDPALDNTTYGALFSGGISSPTVFSTRGDGQALQLVGHESDYLFGSFGSTSTSTEQWLLYTIDATADEVTVSWGPVSVPVSPPATPMTPFVPPLLVVGTLGSGDPIVFADGFVGDIAEVIVYDADLATTEIGEVRSYLRERYGL